MNTRVYSGATALQDFLRPDVKEYTPLVELPAELNPYLTFHDIHIYVKLLNMLPLANVKSLPAWSMLQQAHNEQSGRNIVEASSGNTVFSLGILANAFGVDKVKAVVTASVTPGKLSLLRIAGIDVLRVDGPICPSPDDPRGSIAIARKMGEDDGWYNPGQFDNDFNPQAHRDYTGPQIFEQLEGKVGMFAAGLGTTGTLVGTSEYLKSVVDDVQVLGVVRVPNNAVPGVRTKNELVEVAFPWKEATTDVLIAINERESYEGSLAMIRQGLLVGPSAGFAYKGILKQLDAMQQSGDILSLKGKNVVFVAPDSMFPYADEYMAVLDESQLGAIDDRTSGKNPQEAESEIADVAELTVEDVFHDFVKRDGNLESQHYTLVDVREPREFTDHHLSGSVNVPFEELEAWLEKQTPEKPFVFVCRRGALSLRAAHLTNQRGFESYSMRGGTTEWSAKELPRVWPAFC